MAEIREEMVRISEDLRGAWLEPEDDWDGRAVLLLHGFADDMNGPADFKKRLAFELAEAGIATFRINFRGEGDRERTNIESTLHTRVEDSEAAYHFLLKREGIARAHLGLMGSSLGGATAIFVAGKHPEWFRSMALWSSSGDFERDFFQGRMGEIAKEAMANGQATYEIEGWKTVTLKSSFFESFRGVDLIASLRMYPGALISIRGSEDFLPQYEAAFLDSAPGEPREAVLIGGADHIFNVFDGGKDYADRA